MHLHCDLPLGQLAGGIHLFPTVSRTVPLGHVQPLTHCRVHIGFGLAQVGGQAEPQLLNTWPWIEHTARIDAKLMITCTYLLGDFSLLPEVFVHPPQHSPGAKIGFEHGGLRQNTKRQSAIIRMR